MNDRFKFRVWNKNKHSFTTGGAIKDGGLCFACVVDEGELGIKLGEEQENYIIEQCTGLKDKNGNLIYEGDIVEITIFGSIGPNGGYVDSDEIYKGTVVWVRDCFLVKTADMDMILFPHSEDCTEIIGNIHEQAEQKDVK